MVTPSSLLTEQDQKPPEKWGNLIVRLAEVFDVSCDYLLVETAPRRPLHAPTDHLGDRLNDLATLDPEDQAALLRMLDALVTKTKLRAITGTG